MERYRKQDTITGDIGLLIEADEVINLPEEEVDLKVNKEIRDYSNVVNCKETLIDTEERIIFRAFLVDFFPLLCIHCFPLCFSLYAGNRIPEKYL